MLNRGLFRKPKNTLEIRDGEIEQGRSDRADGVYVKCPGCKRLVDSKDVKEGWELCPECGRHFKLPVRRRVTMLADEGSFQELALDRADVLRPKNPIEFPGYEEKLAAAQSRSGENEGVLCGRMKIGGIDACLFVMDMDFMMGSMGTVVGERLTGLFEYALEHRLPVVGYTVSGGARMQEGILSLMQMAKISGAVKRHSDGGLFYAAILTDPTTGGVTASFAMEADVILAEPGALIGFAGPRVIEQTILKRLPEGFQRAELLLEKGMLDDIVARPKQREYLIRLLRLHSDGVFV